jgi:hypothetical protein
MRDAQTCIVIKSADIDQVSLFTYTGVKQNLSNYFANVAKEPGISFMFYGETEENYFFSLLLR